MATETSTRETLETGNDSTLLDVFSDFESQLKKGKKVDLEEMLVKAVGEEFYFNKIGNLAVSDPELGVDFLEGSLAQKNNALIQIFHKNFTNLETGLISLDGNSHIPSKFEILSNLLKDQLKAEGNFKDTPTPEAQQQPNQQPAAANTLTDEEFMQQQFAGSMGKYMPGGNVPFGKPKSQVGQVIDSKGNSVYGKLHAKKNGYAEQKESISKNYADKYEMLSASLEKIGADREALSNERDASRSIWNLGRGDSNLRAMLKASQKLEEATAKHLEGLEKSHNKEIRGLERKEKIVGAAIGGFEVAAGLKGKLSGAIASLREAGVAELNKGGNDYGHSMLGAGAGFEMQNQQQPAPNQPQPVPEPKQQQAAPNPNQKFEDALNGILNGSAAKSPEPTQQQTAPASNQAPETIQYSAGHSFLGAGAGSKDELAASQEEKGPSFWDKARDMFASKPAIQVLGIADSTIAATGRPAPSASPNAKPPAGKSGSIYNL